MLHEEDSQSVQSHTDALTQPITLTWENVSYDIPVKSGMIWNRQTHNKRILEDINGIVKPGQLLAIIGSSGAGKSTLLDVLAQRKNAGNLQGRILLNGKAAGKSFKRLAGYVTQDDCLSPFLTVTEMFMFYANLKLPSSYTKAERIAKVQSVIKELSLEKVKDSRIGSQFRRGISGGERKRVSIGCQLLTDPPLLFLDEPTTGLDAYNSLSVMQLLTKIARNGRTVICTIHQPRSTIFELFDQLMVLSLGRAIYFGPAQNSVQYLSSVGFECPSYINPADYFIDVVIQNEKKNALGNAKEHTPLLDDTEKGVSTGGKDLAGAFTTSKAFGIAKQQIQETVATTTDVNNVQVPEYARNWFVQLAILGKRTLVNLLRNPMTTYAQLVQTLFMAFLVGSIYFQMGTNISNIQDRMGCLFFIITNQAFGQFASLNIFLEERNLFNRERAGGLYSTSVYFLSKTVIEAPVLLFYPLLFGTLAYWSVGLQAELEKFAIFLGILLSFTIVASSMFIFIGALSPNIQLSQILAPVFTVLFLLFGGFYVNAGNIPIYFKWLSYLSYFKYGYAAMVYNEFSGSNVKFTEALPNGMERTITGKEVLNNFAMEDTVIWQNVVILLSMAIGYRILAYILLRFLYKEKR